MSAIVNYLDVVTLTEAKEYLRIDPLIVETDGELELMINAACRLVEEYSNYRLKPQLLKYPLRDGAVLVYDYPIESIVEPADADHYTSQNRGLYSYICVSDTSGLTTENTIEAQVGYTDTDQVEPLTKLAVLEQVRVWYYNAESDTQRGILSQAIKNMLDPIKRFVF